MKWSMKRDDDDEGNVQIVFFVCLDVWSEDCRYIEFFWCGCGCCLSLSLLGMLSFVCELVVLWAGGELKERQIRFSHYYHLPLFFRRLTKQK